KMWVGTTNGLIALQAETKEILDNISTSDGLLANNITSIAESPVTNTFWLGTNRGLAEVEPETANVLRTITKADGLVDNEVWFYGSVQVGDDGSVYFGTANGISIYKPDLDRKNNLSPTVRLTNALAEEVPGERNEFSFEYAALSFGSERQIRYQTRLIGFNDEWSPEKTDTRVNYTNLPAYLFPKTYTLEVRAVNESGVWSAESLSHNFTVTPPWWLSWGASLGYLFIFGMGIFAVDRFQRKRLIKKEREAALLRETELKAEAAIARSKAAEAQAKVLEAENELKATELEKARELETAYHELKSTQSRLIQAEKMASLGRLSTGIAHEIKNPLNFINNFAALSKELVDELRSAIENNDTSEIEFITENLSLNTGKIEEHGKRADAIVKSMMQHSRNSNMNFELSDLNDIVRKCAELAYHSRSAKIPEFEVSIVTRLDENLPHIMTIQRQLGQVLQNIIENAFDAVWEHKLRQNGTYLPEITIKTSSAREDTIEITISDNGPGIPEPIREKIFEPFFTTKPTGEGTGLGLSISYDIITHIHNGSLKVESDDGRGSRFTILLPTTVPASS
ncbi:MAG: ATP-binding protein, partial [Candidatus Halalkalibacterium sp. M3_1C_030]